MRCLYPLAVAGMLVHNLHPHCALPCNYIHIIIRMAERGIRFVLQFLGAQQCFIVAVTVQHYLGTPTFHSIHLNAGGVSTHHNRGSNRICQRHDCRKQFADMGALRGICLCPGDLGLGRVHVSHQIDQSLLDHAYIAIRRPNPAVCD